jgi:hypothetical protein
LRKEVLELILNASGPMGAYDLLARIKSQTDRPAALKMSSRTSLRKGVRRAPVAEHKLSASAKRLATLW